MPATTPTEVAEEPAAPLEAEFDPAAVSPGVAPVPVAPVVPVVGRAPRPVVVCRATPFKVAVGDPPNGVTDVPPSWEVMVARRLEGMLAPFAPQMPAAPLAGRRPTYPLGQQKKSRLPTCSIWNMFQSALAQTGMFLTAAPQSTSAFRQHELGRVGAEDPRHPGLGRLACRAAVRLQLRCEAEPLGQQLRL